VNRHLKKKDKNKKQITPIEIWKRKVKEGNREGEYG
jgi:hypothetical protein